MRVQFEYTIDDIVDVQMRVLKRSRAARSWRWRDVIVTSLLTGVFLFAVIPEGITGKLIMGGIGLALGALSYAALNERTVKRRLRKLCEENAGPDKSFLCEVELNESGIHTKSNGMQIIYAWQSVTEVQETTDSVDIYAEKGGLVVVRNRAFPSAEGHYQFVELANQYLARAHKSHDPTGAS
jgi:hypothetical protein